MPNMIARYETLDKIPENLREFYVKGQTPEGKEEYRLAIDGDPFGFVKRDAHHASIENGRTLKAQLDEANEKATRLEREKTELAEKMGGKKKDDGTTPELTEILTGLQDKIKTLETAKAQSDTALRRTQVNTILKSAAQAAGITDPAAQADVVTLYGTQYDIAEGASDQVVRKQGEQVVFSKEDATRPETPAEFFTGLKQEKPYLWGVSQGEGPGGAPLMEGGKPVIDGNDVQAMGRHAQDISDGKVVVKYGD